MRLAQLALALPLLHSADALWPFKKKRFTHDAWVDAGSLGLDKIEGRVIAMGDVDGDQNSDLFVLSADKKKVQAYLWKRDAFHYVPGAQLEFKRQVVNVVPADFNADGRLDLLVMMADTSEGGWWSPHAGKPRNDLSVILSGEAGFGSGATWELLPSNAAQPIIFDYEGNLRPSLLGFIDTDEGPALHNWRNNGTGFDYNSVNPLTPDTSVCPLADPHFSAYVDVDGDCRPDIIVDCQKAKANDRGLQVYLNKGEAGYAFDRDIELPRGARAMSYADMNRDGSLDLIFPVCKTHKITKGYGESCTIDILFNKASPVCATEKSQFNKRKNKLDCRGWGELCTADKHWDYNPDDKKHHMSISMEELFPGQNVRLMISAPGAKNIPFPVRPGDFDVDGFPDLLITIADPVTGESWVKVLHNVPCGKGVAGCGHETVGHRGFIVSDGKGWDALDRINDAEGASWIDIDDDGSLDIMVQRAGTQDLERVTFIQNNFYHDAFFLKAQVLNGACDRKCEPRGGGKKYSGLGASYSGAQFKFTVFDTAGRRHAQQVPQLPQTGYQALGSPHTFIGLGRTNNYVENLMVGTSLFPPFQTTNLESLIPNSQVIINPPFQADSDDTRDRTVEHRSSEWRTELFLHPGDWVPWVAAAVVGTVVTLGMVVVWLGEREKREDEKERRRALHAINFQAL